MDIVNGVIQVLDQLKKSGQLNNYLIDDDERKWTKLVYDIMVNKFDMPFGKGTMQQASDIFNNAVRIWKGKNKVGNMMNMESKAPNKALIKLTESDLHNIVKESVSRILSEIQYGGESLHGNNAKDWYALSQVRGQRNHNKYGNTTKSTDEHKKGLHDYKNGEELADGDESIKGKGLRKGNKMIDKLGH